MPHLVLEASANISEVNSTIKQCLIECQQLLVEKLPTQLSSCKSRYIKHEIFVVGDNSSHNAFIHLGVKVLDGRSPQLLHSVTDELRQILKKFFVQSASMFELSISIELTNLSEYYTKVSI